jgi:hypothetical protein
MTKKREKAVFPKELLNNYIEDNNENWINEYKKDTNYKESYYQTLENFFRFKKYARKPFNLFNSSDVGEYVETMIENRFGTNRIDAIISNLSGFKKYLIEKHPDIFSDSLLNDLYELKMGKPEKKYSDAQALNLIQLSYTKEFIKNNIRTEYIFEIFYQLNIRKQDIHICTPENADRKNMVFRKNGTTIKYNNTIQRLLSKIDQIPDFKATYSMVTDHFSRIEDYLKIKGVFSNNRKLSYLDIAKTHEAFFIKCPNCGVEYENISSNWSLAKVNFSEEYYLVCLKCKGEPYNEHIEN